MRALRSLGVLVLGLVLIACHYVTRPDDQVMDRVFLTHQDSLWWEETNQCGGWHDTLDEYLSGGLWVRYEQHINTDRGAAAGMLVGGRAVWVALRFRDDPGVIKHEWMHAHLIPRGIGGHPDRYFGQCGIPVIAG